jgi:hypothetical protein
MTRWARKRELRGVSRPAFPDRVLSPKAANLMSLMTLSLFSCLSILSLLLPFLAHSRSSPSTLILARRRRPRPDRLPSTSSAAAESPSEPTPSPLPAHPPSLSLSSSRALPRRPSPFVAVAASHVFPLSHPASPHPSFPTSVVAKLCLAVPRCCRRSNPRAHQAHLSLRGHGLP